MTHQRDRWISLCAGVFCIDRLLKAAAVWHFFRRAPPAPPHEWPSLTLLQPITRGVHGLEHNLVTRLCLDYPAPIQHLLICDARDRKSQAICARLRASYPQANLQLVLVASDGAVATKIEKLLAALPQACGSVLCFVDDDIALRPAALPELIAYLSQPRAGAVFGLACYSNWSNLWSSLMSAFVNANALLSYIPLCYLAEPFTITGHCFALRRADFDAVGGLERMRGRIDDDHELARRLRAHGLRCIQTPMVYDVDNQLATFAAYRAQMRRWFVFPRLLMAPHLARREQWVMALGSLGALLPSLAALLALRSRSRLALRQLALIFAAFAAVYLGHERRYLGRSTPWRRLATLPLVAFAAPLQVLWSLLAGDVVEWRGQRLRIGRDGVVERLSR